VITPSGEGLVATCGEIEKWHLVTGGSPMTEGRHYWEVELTFTNYSCYSFVGAVRPGLDHDTSNYMSHDVYYIYGNSGGLYWDCNEDNDPHGGFATGDRIGVLLDLDAGWVRFYRNGKRWGPGVTEGVTGPLVRAAELGCAGEVVTALPAAVAPDGAGAADEPWEPPDLVLDFEADY
jgi:hypothetical protein